jgi:hypothetical protein
MKELRGLMKPTSFTNKLLMSTEVIYLTITLNKEFKRRIQLNSVMEKACRDFWTRSCTFVKWWGL